MQCQPDLRPCQQCTVSTFALMLKNNDFWSHLCCPAVLRPSLTDRPGIVPHALAVHAHIQLHSSPEASTAASAEPAACAASGRGAAALGPDAPCLASISKGWGLPFCCAPAPAPARSWPRRENVLGRDARPVVRLVGPPLLGAAAAAARAAPASALRLSACWALGLGWAVCCEGRCAQGWARTGSTEWVDRGG